jgi:hypothetical protein
MVALASATDVLGIGSATTVLTAGSRAPVAGSGATFADALFLVVTIRVGFGFSMTVFGTGASATVAT